MRSRRKEVGMKALTRVALAGMVAVSLLATVPGAMAKGAKVTRSGACSTGAAWKLSVGAEEGGRLEVQFEVEHAKPNKTWHVKLSDNGTRFFSGARSTSSLGRFTVRAITKNRQGSDTIRGRAVSSTGQLCRGAVTF
jgi:hypothetical protein